MNARVFINYRREDAAPYAGRLYDRLTAHFGEDQVFIDIDQIEPGEDFVEVINRKVGTCDIAIVAIGPHWVGATDSSGKRRLDDEEDFVRMEIVAALQRKIRVIPVLVGGARMPGRHDLPEALAPLSRRNAIELSETRFHADVNRLIETIEKPFAVAEEGELSATPAAPPPEPESKDAGRTRLSEEQRTERRGQQKSERAAARKERIGRTQSTKRVGLFVAVGVLVVGIAAVSSWYFGFFRSLGKTSTVVTTQPSVVESRASPKISAPIETPVPPTAALIGASSVPELPTGTAGPKVIANTVYEGTIHVKNDSSTNVPLVITIGSDLKSGTMTQSGHHGDVVVKFTGVWDAATLHAVTDEIVSTPKGINWDPESFTLHFAEDNKSATYECIADGKTYVADLSAQAAPVVKAAPTYKGTIFAQGENSLGTPLTINLAADRKSGTMTQSSRHGDVVVKFTGVWDGDILRAVTNEVISKPKNIQWKPESFTLRFTEDGKRGSYECNSEGHLYTAELSPP
jgi:hypothetical protein